MNILQRLYYRLVYGKDKVLIQLNKHYESSCDIKSISTKSNVKRSTYLINISFKKLLDLNIVSCETSTYLISHRPFNCSHILDYYKEDQGGTLVYITSNRLLRKKAGEVVMYKITEEVYFCKAIFIKLFNEIPECIYIRELK